MNYFKKPFYIFKYSYLIWILALKELKLRYRGSALGFLWTLVNPLLLLSIYTFLFTVIFKSSAKAYPVYFFSGVLVFNWFSSSLNEGTISVVGAGGFITKSTLPSEIVVIVKVMSNFLNYIFSVPVLLVFVLIYRVPLGFPLFVFPFLIAIQFLISIGIAFFFATWNVFYRDTYHIVMNLLQMLFFVMPVMYFDKQLPERLRNLVYLNPIAYLIKCYQGVFYYDTFPRPGYMIFLVVIALMTYIVGFHYYHSRKDLFAECL